MKKQQSGFTLIELVVVIVILGILSAIAVPKFIDLSSDARAGVMKGAEAAMRGTDMMIYGKASANGVANIASSASTPPTVKVNSVDYPTNYGYAKDIATLTSLMTYSSDLVVDTANKMIYHKSASTTAKCSVTYTPATAAGAAPTYTTDTTGC